MTPPPPPRRRLLTRRRFYSALGATLLGGWAYARYVEAGWLDLVRRDLPYPHLSAALDGLSVAQVSDLHIGSIEPDYLIRTLQLVGSLRPDLIALTGDVLTDKYAHQTDLIPPLLDHLGRPPLGTFAVLGNHDYGPTWKDIATGDAVAERLTRCGVRVLRNEWADVNGLQVVGTDDLWSNLCDPNAACRTLDAAKPVLMLSHNPETVDLSGWFGMKGWVLSGHTHGGQCRLPLLPPPVTNLKNRKYVAGEYDLGDGRRVYVSRGVGYVTRLRFCVRPEVTLFRLVKG